MIANLFPPDFPSSVSAWVWLLAAWLTVLGGVIGSFLNVVVYRLPRGKSLVAPGSHCPLCGKPIRWYDNVPVLGWIALRGRCRDCRAPIAMRYPLVEAVAAATFGLLAVVEFGSRGANLPAPTIEFAGAVAELHWTEQQLAAVYVYHLVLLCTLLCAVLIEYDGHRLPQSLFWPAAVAGVALPLLVPSVHPVPAWAGLTPGIAGWIDGLAGLAVGGGLAWATMRLWGEPHRRGAALSSAAVGLYLGWQAALALWAAMTVVGLAARMPARWSPTLRRVPPTAGLAAATLAWILAWSPLVSWAKAL